MAAASDPSRTISCVNLSWKFKYTHELRERKKIYFFFCHAMRPVGSQFQDQGSNLCPLHWYLNHGPPGKSLKRKVLNNKEISHLLGAEELPGGNGEKEARIFSSLMISLCRQFSGCEHLPAVASENAQFHTAWSLTQAPSLDPALN